MVRTFKTLASLADFAATPPAVGVAEPTVGQAEVTVVEKPALSTPGHVININIQLTIPATDDSKIYDSFFASMKKHLLQ